MLLFPALSNTSQVTVVEPSGNGGAESFVAAPARPVPPSEVTGVPSAGFGSSLKSFLTSAGAVIFGTVKSVVTLPVVATVVAAAATPLASVAVKTAGRHSMS